MSILYFMKILKCHCGLIEAEIKIKEFEKISGFPIILNTSFNINGEPIVLSPDDALNTFFNSGLEYLVLEKYLIQK